ncbi:MAG: valine--tRNA ligase [Anaerolineales bacterium]|nr:valine--tRNA ligase [Anaerolineales bacterium]
MNSFKLPKTYDFKATENKIYDWWDQGGYFKPDNDPNQPGFDPQIKPFVISIPPPNVTGELHLGHAMFVSMEDLMIRYHRMKGIPSLWVPGTDHAGIATQLQIEKALSAEGLTREQIGREDFLRRTWEWKEKYGGIITQQIRRLGASCDWDRERFTLDEGLSRSVRAAFVRLYEKGLIYRGPRLINWSPGLKTAVSDLEVEYSEEPGTLYYFKYMLADAQGDFIPVATTRPETILGDTGLAVHPEDPRYQEFIGQEVLVPILDRRIPVIADEYVDREFGTGALKITPGHDPNDYEIGERHGLAVISVLDEAAKVNQHGGPYAGQDRFEARKNLWEDMRAAHLVIKEEPYMINIPRSQRGGEIIEPMISTQWFVRIQPLADAALEAVNDGRIQIIPERFKKVYNNWLENIEDWCISRQLWWGHRIPVWTCQDCSEVIVSQEDPTECTQCESENLVQDPDVLDTWFSSGLWPFSTLGWPEETADYGYFYPTSVMETGYDILFFWVARMIMDGIEFTGQVPFHTVYLHGLIRDETGRKMSKTYGNVIDPLIVMDELGTDALRFTLLVGSTPGNDMNLSLKKVEANRNFANKIWNAARFVLGALEQVQELQFPQQGTEPLPGLADQWIQARLSFLTRDAERLFQNYQYGEAGRQIYEFFWNEFADWYIEIAKLQLTQGDRMAYTTARNLVHVLDTCLRLLHPFTPFVTEEIWGRLKTAVGELKQPIISQHAVEWEDALIIARWPEPAPENPWETKAITDFSLIMELVRAVRNLRSEKNVDPKLKIPATLVGGEKTPLLQQQSSTIAVLARLDPQKITISESLDGKPEGHIALVIGPIEVYLPLAELVDPAEQRARLEKEYATSMSQVERLENLLESPFAKKAPENVIEKERQKLADYQGKVEKIKSQLEALSTSDLG